MATEKRLIDANAVIEKLTNSTPNGWGKDVPYIRSPWAMAVKIKDNFLKALTEAPAVDAVEVVRCKDCIHDNMTTCPLCWIEKHTLQFVNHDPNFYCAYGERRDGE